jgi:hypothetical protein
VSSGRFDGASSAAPADANQYQPITSLDLKGDSQKILNIIGE